MPRRVRENLSNAVCGALDYAAWPLGMLLLAPVLIRHLGVERYGLWAVAIAALNAGAILASGFGDANIREVALQRGNADRTALIRTARSAMSIHVALGVAMALLGWMLASAVATRVVGAAGPLRMECLWSLRIAALTIPFRAIETVCISTQRAFERYGPAVYVSLAGRFTGLGLAAVLAYAGRNVAEILLANLLIMPISVMIQIRHVTSLLGAKSLLPAFDPAAMRALLGFGFFSWVLALASVVVGQTDRLFTGAALGAAAAASYALCVQITQPLYGISSSALHFIYPHLAARISGEPLTVRGAVARATAANLILVAVGALLLVLFGGEALRVLGGPAIAGVAQPILPLVICGTALVSLSVTPYYALLAFGHVRTVAALLVAASAAMIVAMWRFTPGFGVQAIVSARLLYGAIAVLLYIPLAFHLYLRARGRTPELPGERSDSGKATGVPASQVRNSGPRAVINECCSQQEH